MVSRRSYLGALATAITSGELDTTPEREPDCCTLERSGDGPVALSGSPDFTVESDAKTHQVYWLDSDRFGDIAGSSLAVAAAYLGGEQVLLNEAWSHRIDSTVVCHEIGHNLGHEHVAGTVMAPSLSGMTDRQPDVDLADVTVEIFSRMDAATVCDWDGSDGRDCARDLVRRYIQGSDLTRDAVLYGIERYFNTDVTDTYFLHEWDALGGDGMGESLSGQFY